MPFFNAGRFGERRLKPFFNFNALPVFFGGKLPELFHISRFVKNPQECLEAARCEHWRPCSARGRRVARSPCTAAGNRRISGAGTASSAGTAPRSPPAAVARASSGRPRLPSARTPLNWLGAGTTKHRAGEGTNPSAGGSAQQRLRRRVRNYTARTLGKNRAGTGGLSAFLPGPPGFGIVENAKALICSLKRCFPHGEEHDRRKPGSAHPKFVQITYNQTM